MSSFLLFFFKCVLLLQISCIFRFFAIVFYFLKAKNTARIMRMNEII